MSKRRDQLKALFEAEGSANASSPQPQQKQSAEQQTTRKPSGAVKAMGLSLNQVNDDLVAMQKLREEGANGERIQALDPKLIEGAFISDRLSKAGEGDENFDALVESIRETGQQVPVLVRPHPDKKKRDAGWHQAAYGHRRIHATRTLGTEVKAIVQELSDDELVLAQGKENGERRDLSFIERAFFAKGLIDHGFDRAAVQKVLSVDKTQMSRLLQVADAIPDRFVRAIGPAPKAGRPRWLALAAFLKTDAGQVKAAEAIDKSDFKAAPSDDRFQILFNRLSKPKRKTAPKPQILEDAKGRAVARMSLSSNKGVLEINAADSPGFADFVAEQLPKLAEQWAIKNTKISAA